MHSIGLRIADEFTDALVEISSDALPLRIYSAVSLLATFSDSGLPLARKSLVERYGEGIRQLPVSRFVIVCSHVSAFSPSCAGRRLCDGTQGSLRNSAE